MPIAASPPARRRGTGAASMGLVLLFVCACQQSSPTAHQQRIVASAPAASGTADAGSAETNRGESDFARDASSPVDAGPAIGARRFGIATQTPECLAMAARLQGALDDLPNTCRTHGDCLNIGGVGCVGKTCNFAVARGTDVKSIRRANEALRKKCGPCVDEVVSCAWQEPRCVGGECTF
jgi:hypothetical protein